jgi:hypothetical protein
MNVVSPFHYETHAPEVRKWLTKHNFPLPPENILPTTGFIIEDLACGFLYSSNSRLGWIEWVFSNPEKTQSERSEALDILFLLLETTAKELKIEVLFSSSKISAYSDILLRNGFKETDKNMTHYIKMIGED